MQYIKGICITSQEEMKEIRLRLYVPRSLRAEMLVPCHDKLCHMEIDKTCDQVGRHYYWLELCIKFASSVQSCVVWQIQNRRQEMFPLEKTDIPNFHFEKVSMDASGQYGKTPRGNVYIVSFVGWLTNWPKAYAVPNKKTQTMADLILNEIFPKYGAPV